MAFLFFPNWPLFTPTPGLICIYRRAVYLITAPTVSMAPICALKIWSAWCRYKGAAPEAISSGIVSWRTPRNIDRGVDRPTWLPFIPACEDIWYTEGERERERLAHTQRERNRGCYFLSGCVLEYKYPHPCTLTSYHRVLRHSLRLLLGKRARCVS